ncbi:hypothetical protein OG455_14080 [Kitasatospora sp. NBC_01287]|uniref:hypothetical protein n=1 Tax=Kitasatospora sp. NBC_01287 TaxID=2903573 RepID=UPI002259400C|nr:hypothetical protein [Kitasatospora sp. NBC_01287]MCX4746633.1 hypothetical protein [Kitasatospora sp. NBC_01287]
MTELEYQLVQQRGAELRELAAHERLVAEARRVARTTRQTGGRRGGLTAGLRRSARPAHRADLGEC